MRWLNAIIRRVVISAVREGAIKRFDASGLPGESFRDREHFQHYGFTSSPLDGAEGVVIGCGNMFFLIAEDDRRYRIASENGEVAIYTDEGDKIHLKRGKIIEVTTNTLIVKAATKVELGEGAIGRIVTTESTCAYTGGPHPDGCAKVFAKK